MGRDDKIYNDFLNLDGCYFVYVCVRDPVRSRDLEDRKEAERRREERNSLGIRRWRQGWGGGS